MALAPSDLFELEGIVEPRISPSGSQIAYVRRSIDTQTDRRHSAIWLINADGSHDRPIAEGFRHDSYPVWSPDGRQLAFLSRIEGKTQIFLWDGEIRQLTSGPQSASYPSWSPDGKYIAFISKVTSAAPALFSFPSPPDGASWAPPPIVVTDTPYQIDGRGLTIGGYSQLFTVHTETRAIKQITHSKRHHGSPEWMFRGIPQWTPDGKTVIILGLDDIHTRHENALYAVDLASGIETRLTPDTVSVRECALSPNGAHVAFTGYEETDRTLERPQLYLMAPDGSNLRRAPERPATPTYLPCWTADSTQVLFLYDEQGASKVGALFLDGNCRTVATHLGGTGNAYGGRIGGGDFSLSRNGSLVFNQTQSHIPPRLCLIRAKGDAPEILTSCNRDLHPLKAEEFSYLSTVDGREIHGWVIKPPEFSPDTKWPLLLHVHGGPMLNFGDRFDVEHQLWASAGYVVCYINYRGSTSYGAEFARLIDGCFPLGVMPDLLDATTAMVDTGYIDHDNLFITGPSAGGCLTCWTIGHDHRFRAAAACYPVINWATQSLTSDHGRWFLPDFWDQYPWENPKDYFDRSPIAHVGHVQTPTLILCGEKDSRTPISQAEQYFQALCLRGIDTAFVRFPGGHHGLRARPSQHLAKIQAVVEWFDRYKTTEPVSPSFSKNASE